MGIQGIYRELGPGRRVSLTKLAADTLKKTGRPLRLAIDIAIWQFQTQAARGGTNPAIRTLFYRLVRLIGTPIQPIFVFDGPDKPKVKRNKRSGRGDGVAAAQAKRLIRLFGLVVHDAPGEAEADCALLQRNGIVDAVLSEDVDTIMFGCTRTLRNWSAESKTAKAPTHVSMYDVNDGLVLGREEMILVALMSGGDYLPEGIPGCGPKVACEAAKAGYGKSLCRLKASETEELQSWKASLQHELNTNEKKVFRTRHKALTIPDDFPNMEVLRYYTHPVVSPDARLEAVRKQLDEARIIHLDALREFTRETFSWDFRIGAIKFIRVLGQALLVHNLVYGGALKQAEPEKLIQRISSRRQHFSADNTPELRLAFIPEEVVPIDISGEVDEDIPSSRDGLALNSDEEVQVPASTAEFATIPSKMFDISTPDLAWVSEDVVKLFAPHAIEDFKAKQANSKLKSPVKKKKAAKAKAKAKKPEDMPRGAMDKFVRVVKAPGVAAPASTKTVEILDTTSFTDKTTSLPKPKILRRPRTPSSLRDQSKPSSPASDSIFDYWIDLPTSPRHPISGKDCSPIIITSSPPNTAASPTNSSPAPSPPRALPTSSGEVPKSIHSILSANNTRTGVKKASKKTPTSRPTSPSKGSQGGKLKQMSMDLFTKRVSALPNGEANSPKSAVLASANRGSRSQTLVADDDPDVEIISSTRLVMQDSPPTFNFPDHKSSAPSTRNSSPCPSPKQTRKKKLLVPRASGAGFFDEVEVDEAEYEERQARESRLLRDRGIHSLVTRYCDVSIIDLT